MTTRRSLGYPPSAHDALRPFFNSIQRLIGGTWGHSGGNIMLLTADIKGAVVYVGEDGMSLYRGSSQDAPDDENMVAQASFYDVEDRRLSKAGVLEVVREVVRQAPRLLRSKAGKAGRSGSWYWELAGGDWYRHDNAGTWDASQRSQLRAILDSCT